jgi:hypothetical protein
MSSKLLKIINVLPIMKTPLVNFFFKKKKKKIKIKNKKKYRKLRGPNLKIKSFRFFLNKNFRFFYK